MHQKATLTEMRLHWDIDDLADAHEALDIEHAIERIADDLAKKKAEAEAGK